MNDVLRDRDGGEWPEATTIDGEQVVPGLIVLDYNFRVGVVTDAAPSWENGVDGTQVPWFHLTTGFFDGSRMWAYDPNTGRKVSESK